MCTIVGLKTKSAFNMNIYKYQGIIIVGHFASFVAVSYHHTLRLLIDLITLSGAICHYA